MTTFFLGIFRQWNAEEHTKILLMLQYIVCVVKTLVNSVSYKCLPDAHINKIWKIFACKGIYDFITCIKSHYENVECEGDDDNMMMMVSSVDDA